MSGGCCSRWRSCASRPSASHSRSCPGAGRITAGACDASRHCHGRLARWPDRGAGAPGRRVRRDGLRAVLVRRCRPRRGHRRPRCHAALPGRARRRTGRRTSARPPAGSASFNRDGSLRHEQRHHYLVLVVEHDLPVAARAVRDRTVTCSAMRWRRSARRRHSVSVTLADGSRGGGRPAGLRRRGRARLARARLIPGSGTVLCGLRRLARHAAGAGAVTSHPEGVRATRSTTRC